MVVGAQNLCAIEASTTKVERRPPRCDAKVMMAKGEIRKEYPAEAKPPHQWSHTLPTARNQDEAASLIIGKNLAHLALRGVL